MGGHNSPITLNEKPISPLTLDALIGEGLYHTTKFARDSTRHKIKGSAVYRVDGLQNRYPEQLHESVLAIIN